MIFRITTLGAYLKTQKSVVLGDKKVRRRRNGCLIVECVYCRRTGLDHDGISDCPVCRGKKRVLVKEPVVACAFCKGKGKSDGNATVCRVCHGKAYVTVEPRVEKCPDCLGRGRITGTDLMCIRCSGKGVVKVNNGKGGGEYGGKY